MSQQPSAAQIDQTEDELQRIEAKVDRIETKLNQLTEALQSLMQEPEGESDEDRIDQILEKLMEISHGNSLNHEALNAIDSTLREMKSSRRSHAGGQL